MKRESGTAGVGTASVVLIAMVLLLTVFGVLALLTARADQKLTDRTHAAAVSYYAADAEAQRILAAVDEALAQGRAVEVDGVVQKGDSYAVSIRIDEVRALYVEWRPAQGLDDRYIICYNVTNEGAWDVTEYSDLADPAA